MSAGSRDRLVLGFDPGTALTGYGLILQQGNRLRPVDHGVVATASEEPAEIRLDRIHREVRDILARHAPDAVAVESLFFNMNVQTAMAVGQARGVVLLACAQHGCEVAEYTPQQVKQAVAGYGKAGKQQVQAMVKTLLNLADIPKPDDAADALGIAICHAHSAPLLGALKRQGGG